MWIGGQRKTARPDFRFLLKRVLSDSKQGVCGLAYLTPIGCNSEPLRAFYGYPRWGVRVPHLAEGAGEPSRPSIKLDLDLSSILVCGFINPFVLFEFKPLQG